MSYTFSPEGIKIRTLMHVTNWNILFNGLRGFCFNRGWNLQNENWIKLCGELTDKVWDNKQLLAIDYSNATLYDYLIKFLNEFDEIKLNDIDKAAIKKFMRKERGRLCKEKSK